MESGEEGGHCCNNGVPPGCRARTAGDDDDDDINETLSLERLQYPFVLIHPANSHATRRG